MSLNEAEQIRQLLEQKKHILITFRKDYSGDSIASALALFLFLTGMNKRAEIICENFELPKKFTFLRRSDRIKKAFSHLQKFVINIDTAKTGVEELSYDLKGEKLRIFITPKEGFLTRDNIQTAQSDFKYDLIFTLDTPNLESLGSLYDNNTELFYQTPLVNIDYRPTNEHYGQINVVDLTATSTAEVLFDVLTKIGEKFITNHTATALLTGMIANTQSFKSGNVKPHTMALASKLMDIGADRERIIENLYQTRTIPALKLWGQALTHLEIDNSIGLVSTIITRDDFLRSGASEQDLYDIVNELIANSPEAKIILLLHEHTDNKQHDTIHGIIHTEKGFNTRQLLPAYKLQGDHNHASFIVENKKLKEAEEEIMAQIKKNLVK